MVILGSAAGPGSRSGLRAQVWSGASSRQILSRPLSGSVSRSVSRSGVWLGSWAKSKARSSGWSASRTRVWARVKSCALSRSTIA